MSEFAEIANQAINEQIKSATMDLDETNKSPIKSTPKTDTPIHVQTLVAFPEWHLRSSQRFLRWPSLKQKWHRSALTLGAVAFTLGGVSTMSKMIQSARVSMRQSIFST